MVRICDDLKQLPVVKEFDKWIWEKDQSECIDPTYWVLMRKFDSLAPKNQLPRYESFLVGKKTYMPNASECGCELF